MVKPKDDLRKDFRLVEFYSLIKRFFNQDSKARHRRLCIHTYATMCVYRMCGLGTLDRSLRQCALTKTDPIEKKRVMFTDVLLVRHLPMV